jgi:hypothetical protein
MDKDEDKLVELSGDDLVKKVFVGLYDKYGKEKVPLIGPVSVFIMKCGHQIGTFKYYDLSVLDFNGRKWLMALGKRVRYVSGYCPYISDIVAFEIKGNETKITMIELLKSSVGNHFKKSLIVSMDSGYVWSKPDGYFGSKIIDKIAGDELIANEAIDGGDGFVKLEGANLDGMIIYIKTASYQERAIDVCINAIASILS